MALRRSWVRIPLGPLQSKAPVLETGVYIYRWIRVVGYLPESWGHRVKAPTTVSAERRQICQNLGRTELAYHPPIGKAALVKASEAGC